MERRHDPRLENRPRDGWWVGDPRRSLRARAALLAGGSALALVLFVATVAGHLLRRSLEAELSTGFETLAFQVSDKIDRTLFERYRTLRLAASLEAMRRPGTGAAERRRLLETVQDATSDYAWIGFIDPTGRVTAGTNGWLEGTSLADRSVFRAAREHAFLGPPHEDALLVRQLPHGSDPEGTLRFLDVAVPVAGPNGAFAGVIAGKLRWSWARDVYLSVIPEHLLRDRLTVTVYAGTRDVLLDSGAHGWSSPPDAPTVPEAQRLRGSMVEDAGHARYLAGYVRSRGFRDYRGLGWLTVVRQPLDRVFAPVAELRRRIVFLAFVLAIAAGVLAWWAASGLARRMRSVGAAADRIRSGDIMSVMPRPAGQTEIAQMCRSLGEMVDEFRARDGHPTLTAVPRGQPRDAPSSETGKTADVRP